MLPSTVSNSSPNLNSNGSKAKHWTFTIINPSDAHISKFEDIKEFTTYWIYGKEVAPTTGTPHLQCYLVGKKQITLPTMRRWFGTSDGHSFAVSMGTPEQNRVYCSKEGSFVEWGTLPEARNKAGGEATKRKWETIAQNAKEGKLDLICAENPKEFVTNYRTLKQIGFDFQQNPDNLKEPCGEWIFGKTGIGKSFTARKENPKAYIKPMNKWWDHYNNEEVVIIEDMSPSYSQSMEYFMKIWPDCYAFPAEIKNHIVSIRPKKIVVTSQYHPKDIWSGEALDAILRRFKLREIIKIKEDGVKFDFTKKVLTQKPMKKHDKPFLKTPAKFQHKNNKIVPNRVTQPKLTTYVNDAQDIDELIDCAEIEQMGGYIEDVSSDSTNEPSYGPNHPDYYRGWDVSISSGDSDTSSSSSCF